MDKNKFDVVIIGSSPIMVMKAIEQSQKGKKVVIIEKDKCLGGAWKTAFIEGLGNVECHCHVIDPYGNIYNAIYKLLGIKFQVMNPQPIRVDYQSGKKVRYVVGYNRITGLIMKLDAFLSKFFRSFVRGQPKGNISADNKYKTSAINDNYIAYEKYNISNKKILNFLPSKTYLYNSLDIIIRFVLGKLKPIQEPIDEGYSGISDKLHSAIIKNGIKLIHAKAKLVEKKPQKFQDEKYHKENQENENIQKDLYRYLVHLEQSSNECIKAKNIFISQSADITIHSSIINNSAKTIMKEDETKTILVSIDKTYCKADKISNYIHIDNSDVFVRIGKCKTKDLQKSYFLVQIKKDIERIREKIYELLVICGIAKRDMEMGGGG